MPGVTSSERSHDARLGWESQSLSVVLARRQTTNSFFGEFPPLDSLYPNILSDLVVVRILVLARFQGQNSRRYRAIILQLSCLFPCFMANPSISLSPAAVAEVERLRRKQNGLEAPLRVRVRSGGCAELYYDLSFEENPDGEDRCCTCDGVAIAVDVLSLPYVDGLTIDYTEDLMGGGFRFHNPHAERTCSCGHSFVPQADLTAH